jgi:hypothetical protein
MYKAARVPVRDEDGNGSINHESDETSHGTDEGGALHNVVQELSITVMAHKSVDVTIV